MNQVTTHVKTSKMKVRKLSLQEMKPGVFWQYSCAKIETLAASGYTNWINTS